MPLLPLRTPTLPSAGLGYSLLSGSPFPSPTKEQHRKLSSDEMYLLDSGGQYWYVFPDTALANYLSSGTQGPPIAGCSFPFPSVSPLRKRKALD